MISAVGQPLQAKESGSLRGSSDICGHLLANSASVIGVFVCFMATKRRGSSAGHVRGSCIVDRAFICGSCGKEKAGVGRKHHSSRVRRLVIDLLAW
jgi:hypothetical protein